MGTIITIGQKHSRELTPIAKKLGQLLNLEFYPRNNQSIENLQKQYKVQNILVITNEGPKLYTSKDKFHHYHLSMAQLRLLKISRGEGDHLLEAVGNEPLDSFLDCTLGLGSDSLVVSYSHPECQKFIGLEAQKELAYITNYGFRHFQHEEAAITEALRRIQVLAIHYEDYFTTAVDDSIDVIYFDPMFSTPVLESPQFLALRGYTLEQKMQVSTLARALEVTKQKVIIKERPFATFFKDNPPDEWYGGKYSRICYGVYYKNYLLKLRKI